MGNRNRLLIGLRDAAYALEERAIGRNPELSRVLSGAITLNTLFRQGALDTEMQDAALLLEQLVTTDGYHLDAGGKSRAARLAGRTRVLADHFAIADSVMQDKTSKAARSEPILPKEVAGKGS